MSLSMKERLVEYLDSHKIEYTSSALYDYHFEVSYISPGLYNILLQFSDEEKAFYISHDSKSIGITIF